MLDLPKNRALRQGKDFDPREMVDFNTPRMLTGLIGANIGNSLSPALHDFAFSTCGIAGHYHAMDLDRLGFTADDLPRILDFVRIFDFAGVNVTHPIKQRVIPFLDHIDPTAEDLGAVNTITARDGVLTGFNTDWVGFRHALENGLGESSGSGQSCLLLGAGGAGRAVCYALIKWGADSITVFDQSAAAADRLIADFSAIAGKTKLLSGSADDTTRYDGIINATPIGMFGYPGTPLSGLAIPKSQWVADVIYTPVQTEFIKSARDSGLSTVTGDLMCVGQAISGFEIMTGLTPDRDAMAQEFSRLLISAEEVWAARD